MTTERPSDQQHGDKERAQALRSTGSIEADKVLRAAHENADYWMRAAHDVETGPAPERLLAAEQSSNAWKNAAWRLGDLLAQMEAAHAGASEALRARSAGTRIAEGWKLVPCEPTPEMLNRGGKFSLTLADAYKDMVNAAPEYAQSARTESDESR